MNDAHLSNQSVLERAQGTAREYAWRWFEYHAGQRQMVFRFFLIAAGAVAGGYLSVAHASGLESYAYFFGIFLVILAGLFWRLDQRNRDLIEGAQNYLKDDEKHLASVLGTDAIKIAANGHKARDKAPRWFQFRLYTFNQIYRWLFLLIGAIGLLILIFDPHSPIRLLLGHALGSVCRAVGS